MIGCFNRDNFSSRDTMQKKYNKSCSTLITLLVAILLFSSCQRAEKAEFTCNDVLGCVNIAPGDNIQLGVLQALSGGVAPLGQAQIRGFELALEEIENEILGHPIKLQIEDTGCTAEGGANAALKIIAEPQTIAIFGTTCSGAAATASKAMSAAGLTMISGNNSAPFLTSIAGKAAPDWQPGYFRTASNEERAGYVAAEYAYKQLSIRSAAAINDGDIYTRGLTESFKTGFEKLGGSIVLHTAINKGDLEMRPVLKAVVDSGADLLFFPLFQPEGNIILKQARKMDDFDDVVLMSDGALIQETFLSDVGDLAEGMYFIGPAKPTGALVDNVVKRYIAKYQEEPTVSYYLSGYDAAGLMLCAIEEVAVRSDDGSLHIGRQALRDRLYSVEGFEGVTGSLSCNQFGDCAQPSFNVLRLDNPEMGLAGLESNIVYSSDYSQQ